MSTKGKKGTRAKKNGTRQSKAAGSAARQSKPAEAPYHSKPTASRSPGHREVVEITAIAAGGAGVARLADGRVAFIRRTAPGDRVEIEVTDERSRWVKAQAEQLIEPGPDRTVAPCPLYDRCGGCSLQHMTGAAQLRARAEIVADALRRIGGIDVDVPEIVASPNEFRYRNRVSFTLRRLRWGKVIAGFHELDHPGRVADIDHRCLLPEPILARAWRSLRRGWGPGASRLPAGRSLRLTLRSTLTGEVSLLVEDGSGDGRPAELLAQVPEIVAVWTRSPGRAPVLLAGAPILSETHEGETVELEGAVFVQVNRTVAALLEDYVRTMVGPVAGLHVIDAYSGAGVHARWLSRNGARVTSIEADRRAVAETVRACGPSVNALQGRVEKLIEGVLPADMVIVNPPRAGLEPEVCEALVAQPPARVVYISCDPATLARDCAKLAPTFRAESVRCFDMFPQTAHVETVMELKCVSS